MRQGVGVVGAMLLSAGIAQAGGQSDEEILERLLRDRQQRVEAGLTIDDRMEGTARVEIAGLIRVTYPTPQLRFKSKVSLREAYDDPLIRGAMGIYQESTKPPTIRVEVLS